MLIVNQLIPCDYSDPNVSSEMSSDSSGESQDLGEVNTGLKMAYFPNVSRPPRIIWIILNLGEELYAKFENEKL